MAHYEIEPSEAAVLAALQTTAPLSNVSAVEVREGRLFFKADAGMDGATKTAILTALGKLDSVINEVADSGLSNEVREIS